MAFLLYEHALASSLSLPAEMLKESNLTIAEVAFAVGYQDSSQFSRLFKKHLGQSPSFYRKTVGAKLFSPI